MFMRGKRSVLARFSIAIENYMRLLLVSVVLFFFKEEEEKGRFHRTAFVPAHSCSLKGSQAVLFMFDLM